jgi:hypothetical protein
VRWSIGELARFLSFGERHVAYIDDTFNLAEHLRNGLTDEWNGLKQAGFANQDVQESLVDTDELLESEVSSVGKMCVGNLTSRKAS